MSLHRTELEFTEPERYELHEGPFYHFELNRREFAGVLGAGVLLCVAVPGALAQRAQGARRPATLEQRMHLGADGVITVMTSKVEAGQGSRTQLTQAAAEELAVSTAQIRLVMADTAMGPDDGGTAGSRTTPSTVPAIRRACAAARRLLLDTASATYGVEAGRLTVRDGKVQGLAAGQSFTYADLAGEKHRDSLKREAAPGVDVTPVDQWRVLGAGTPRVNGRDIVTGKHQYPSDITRPGMLHGCVLRPTSQGAQLVNADLQPGRAIADVVAVRDGDFVGFAAPSSFLAGEARDAVSKTAEWKSRPHPSSDDLYSHLRTTASTGSGRGRNVRGAPDEAFKTAARKLRESYHIAYVQHAPMEPRAAVAEWTDDTLTVWTGTQQPSRVRGDLAQAFRLPQEKVRVIVPDMGGGFGGKHSGEVAVEAARLARAAGRPVSVRWTREEEFTWAYFRPAGVIDMAGALDAQGRLTAWEQVNFNSGASAIATPYTIPNALTQFRNCDAPLRSGSYRALAATANTFARESFMDELAASAGVGPLEFRLKHLPEDRLRAVLVAATDRFGWKKEWKTDGSNRRSGVGLACGTEKGSFVATCARVEVDESAGTYRVARAVTAFECGPIMNPLNLQAQVDGCVIMGLGGAAREEMRFKDGRILNAGFRQYRVPRFKDVPELETVLLNRKDLPPVGAGETPIIGIAPAIANALFNAVQVRIRSLPIRNEKFHSA